MTNREPSESLLRVHYSVLASAIRYNSTENTFPHFDVQNTALVESIVQYLQDPSITAVVNQIDLALAVIRLAIIHGLDRENPSDDEEAEAKVHGVGSKRTLSD